MATDPAQTPAAPAIILVTPQLGENIGAAARAMLNCGLTDLRLVAPRDGWPNSAADRAAVGALDLMPPVRVFDQLGEAIADLTMVYATTARDRQMVKPIVTARQAALEARVHLAAGGKVGFVFGPERTGLLSDDVSLANKLITVPLNPAFTSLNLGQAVLLIGYEWFQSGDETPASQLPMNGTLPATQAELQNFFVHLERELDACGFLRNLEARPHMIRNLRVDVAARRVDRAGGPHPARHGQGIDHPARPAAAPIAYQLVSGESGSHAASCAATVARVCSTAAACGRSAKAWQSRASQPNATVPPRSSIDAPLLFGTFAITLQPPRSSSTRR